MLGRLKRTKNGPFGYGNIDNFRRTYEKQRRGLAFKLGNPRLEQVTFHTLRHWKATMLYHQTKDILYVMRFLGHKSIKNTLLYVQLEEALYTSGSDEYISKAATKVEEILKLVEAGFEYVCDVDEAKVFRKRK